MNLFLLFRVMTINSMLSLAGSFIGIPLFMYLAEVHKYFQFFSKIFQSWQYGSLCGGRKFNRAMPFIIALLKTVCFPEISLCRRN